MTVLSAEVGASLTGVTVMVEVATPLWAATVEPSSEDSTSKLPAVLMSLVGLNFRPAWASAKVM